MERLIETSLWVDFTRQRSPVELKSQIRPFILARDACLCKPVIFEVLRAALPQECAPLDAQFAVIPILRTPALLWRDAARLGQFCRNRRFTAGSLDLLIAALAIHHAAEVVTFDADYSEIAKVEPALKVHLLTRAV